MKTPSFWTVLTNSPCWSRMRTLPFSPRMIKNPVSSEISIETTLYLIWILLLSWALPWEYSQSLMHCFSTVKNGILLFKYTWAAWLDCPADLWALRISLWALGKNLKPRAGHYISRSIEEIISTRFWLLKLQTVTLYPPPISRGEDSRIEKRVPDFSNVI